MTKLNPTGSAPLVYSTYLGGNGDDAGNGIAVDGTGNAYVTGNTGSTNFPTTPGAFQTTSGGSYDAFVTKLNPTGSAPLVYSTYLGGSDFEFTTGIALDALPNPNAYVVGFTLSTNFPTTPGAFQTSNAGSYDAFVARIVDAVVPPGPVVGKVTGGGSIDVAGGIGTFGFIVQRQAADQSIKGDLQYVNHSNGEKVHSVMFDSLVITSNTAAFGGACTVNNAPCTFTVEVQDNGEPGTNDSFNITVNAGPTEGAGEKLRSGDIQIHQ